MAEIVALVTKDRVQPKQPWVNAFCGEEGFSTCAVTLVSRVESRETMADEVAAFQKRVFDVFG